MKTADSSFARSLPQLAVTAVSSAVAVVVVALILSQLTGGERQPTPQMAARVEQQPPPVSPPKQATPPETRPAVARPATPETERPTLEPQPDADTMPAAPTTVKPAGTKTLADARAEYERERAEFKQAVAADLALRETAARESASSEALKRATDASAAFAQGVIPNDAPEPALSELMAARSALVTAIQQEIHSARGNLSEPQVAALDKELTDFQIQESADIGNVIQRFPKCVFRLINLETGLALAAKSTGRGSAVIQAKEDPANLLQHWYVTYPGKPYSRVKNRGSKTVLNVPSGNRAGGVKIILWEDKSSDFNFWELQYRGSYYHVRSRFSNKLLSVPAAKKEEGLQLIQWPHHDAPDDQKWRLVRVLTEGEPD